MEETNALNKSVGLICVNFDPFFFDLELGPDFKELSQYYKNDIIAAREKCEWVLDQLKRLQKVCRCET
jgi:hypothetical protein